VSVNYSEDYFLLVKRFLFHFLKDH